ncbi:MAG: hypothetical protein PHY12_00840 [Eubacteriales bacterium]|nr:hypothetical protein [Eubacteriales bacterium]
MKKLISAILVLTLTLSICACSFAEGDTVTLAELKATAPESVSFTIGGEVYDAPVILPEADEISLLLCKHQTYDTSRLREKYPYTSKPDRYEREADALYNYDGAPNISYDVGSRIERYGRTDTSARYVLPLDATPPEVELTPDDAASIVRDRMIEFGGDPSIDLRVWCAVAMSGRCYVKWGRYTSPDGKVGFRMPVADPENPVKNGSVGAWDIQLAQYVNGAPIFPYSYFPTAESYRGGAGSEPGMFYETFDISSSIYILNENQMAMNGSAAIVENTLVFDYPLASFQTLVHNIQQRIDEGQLQSVYSITLGYMAVPVKGEDFQYYAERPNTDARFVLVPTWNVVGYDLKDRSSREGYGYSVPDREAVLQAGPAVSSYYEVRFDAQTGKALTYYQFNLEDYAQ